MVHFLLIAEILEDFSYKYFYYINIYNIKKIYIIYKYLTLYIIKE